MAFRVTCQLRYKNINEVTRIKPVISRFPSILVEHTPEADFEGIMQWAITGIIMVSRKRYS